MSKSKSLIGIVTLFALLSLVLSGCTAITDSAHRLVGSGKAATRDYDMAGFNAIDINSAFKVTVTRGDAYKVSVTADDNVLDYVQVTKNGGTLTIALDNGRFTSFNVRTTLQASITMPELQGVRQNGATQVTMTGFRQTSRFQANLDGASKLTGDVQATDIRLNSNGASQYNLTGTGATLALDANGASRANLSGLAVDRASVSLNGASQANVNAKANLDYDLNGASRLTYAGSPSVGNARTEGASNAARE